MSRFSYPAAAAQSAAAALAIAIPRAIAVAIVLIVAGTSSTVLAQTADETLLPAIVVTAQHLDLGRSQIQTQTGANTYTFDSAAIGAEPGGTNVLLNQVVLQAPDVTQDSFGQFHIRGEHNGLQYRINGIILPEGISVFGQALDPRFIASLSLIDGALPAEYGLRTAGIIDITTRNGLESPGGVVSLYGGSHGEVEPSLTYGGGSGSFSYLVTGDFLRNDLGIESPDGSSNPIHDHTTQYHGFGYFENILNDQNRIALMVGSSVGKFQIPDLDKEQPPDLLHVPGAASPLNVGGVPSPLNVDGVSSYPSQNLNENQREVTQFGALSWQHSAGAFDLQSSVIARYSSLTFIPDVLGDLLYDGVAQDAFKQNMAYAAQTDGSYRLNDEHTIRSGLFLQSDHSISATTTGVLLINPATGDQISDVPASIIDNGAKTEWIYSGYLQDEWKLLPNFTVNYGLRYDKFTAYAAAKQLSPRVNMVWQALPDTTVHTGYSRYLSPPPFELVGAKDVALFQNTTYPPLAPGAAVPQAEHANYFDLGVQQKIQRFTVGLDSYYKQSVNLIDEGQFGAPIILTPFNYRYGKQYGGELTVNYATKTFSAYLNLAVQSAKGKDIDSAQYNFSESDLAYIANNYIHLDHEQQHTASGGVSYLWNDTRFSADFIFGSGLRADLELPAGESNGYGGTDVPNGEHLPTYAQVNTGLMHVFTIPHAGTLTTRFDVVNLFDRIYEIRNGTGVGVGAPQFGPRRGLFFGLSKSL